MENFEKIFKKLFGEISNLTFIHGSGRREEKTRVIITIFQEKHFFLLLSLPKNFPN